MKFYLLLLGFLLPMKISLVIAPPGTTQIGENRFLDEKTVTYSDYQEFLNYYKRYDLETYFGAIPDTLITFKEQQLWNNSKFEDHPIVGLDKFQIESYCMWRSLSANINKSNPNERATNLDYWRQFDDVDPTNDFKIVYSLPTESDLYSSSKKKNKFNLKEHTDDGFLDNNKSTNKFNRDNLSTFRCVAYYLEK